MAKYVLLALYVIFIVYVGIKSRSSARDSSEGFLLGGRSIGPVLSSFSFAATYVSGVCIVNAGKFGWNYGIGALYNAWGNVLLGIFLMWFLLGSRSRTMSEKLGVQTLPDFLKARFNTDYFKIAGGLVIFIFLVPYTASVFTCLCYMFESVFHIPYTWSLVAMALLAIFYLTIGGYKAAASIDVIQGVIMLIGGIVIVFFTLTAPEVGGLVNGVARLKDVVSTTTAGAPVTGFELTSWNLGGNFALLGGLLPMLVLTSLAPNGLPQLAQKFFAIKSAKLVKIGGIVCTILGFIILTSIHIPGFFAHLFYETLPIDSVTGNPNIDLLAPQILAKILPEFFLAIVLLLVLSASMSTLAGLVLVSSSAVGLDLVKGYLRKDMSERKVTLLLKGLSALFILAALAIALVRPAAIIALMGLSWGAVAGFFMSAFIYGILSRNATRAGAVAGSICGFVLAAGLPLFKITDTVTACMYACLIPLAVTPVVSYFTEKMEPQFIEFAYSEDISVIGYDHQNNTGLLMAKTGSQARPAAGR